MRIFFVLFLCLATVCGDCEFFNGDNNCDTGALQIGCIDTNNLDSNTCYTCNILADGSYSSFMITNQGQQEISFYTDNNCNDEEVAVDGDTCTLLDQRTPITYVTCDRGGCGNPEELCEDVASTTDIDADFCPKITSCADPGDSCEFCIAGVEEECENFCGDPYTCKNGTCMGIPDLDDVCDDDDDCDTVEYIETDRGFSLECNGGKCRRRSVDTQNRMYPGDECATQSDCVDDDDDNVDCVDGECFGTEEDKNCDSTSECNPGLRCTGDDPKTCTNLQGSGASCDDDDNNICEIEDLCVDGICTLFASIAEDDSESCERLGGNSDIESACQDGLTCDNGGCVALVFNEDEAECNLATEEEDCGEDGNCLCDYNVGERVCAKPDATCRSDFRSYLSCIDSNNCHQNSNADIPGSCAYKNCRGSLSDYQLCLYNRQNDGDINDFFPSGCRNSAASLMSWISFLF